MLNKKEIILIFILLNSAVFAQNTLWKHKIGGEYADYLFDAIPTLDYGFLMVGGTLSDKSGDVKSNAGDFDCFISKLNEDGDTEWTKVLGGKQTDVAKVITDTYDGGYIIGAISNSGISGNKTSPNIGANDIWLIKMDFNGNITWQKTLGGLANEFISDIVKTQDGGFLIVAGSNSDDMGNEAMNYTHPDLILKTGENNGNTDYWLVKLDSNGDLQWQKTFGSRYKDVLIKAIELPDRSIIIAGNSNSLKNNIKNTDNIGLTDWWVLRISEQGNIIWQKLFGTEGDDHLTSLTKTKDNNLLLGGYFGENKGKNHSSDFALIKIDFSGNMIWQNTYDKGANDFLTDILQNPDGSLILSGYTEAKPNLVNKKIALKKGIEDFLILKTDDKGNELWSVAKGTSKKEVLRRSIVTRDGGYVLMGSSMPHKPHGKNNADFLILKLRDKDKPLHEKLPLETIPNPAVTHTSVVIGKNYEKGILKVVDISGKTVIQKDLKGSRLIPLDMRHLPVGVYIINVEVDDLKNSLKVIKAKH